jgi:Spy/CpxP family protein refolding chaperone
MNHSSASRRPAAGLLALLAALIVAVPLSAGSGKVKWWLDERFITELSLRVDQSDHIEEIFQASWPDLKAHKDDLDHLEQALSVMIAEGTATEAAIVKQIDRVEASRSALGRARSLMLYRMYRVLSPQQRRKLKALYDAIEREKHGESKSSAKP